MSHSMKTWLVFGLTGAFGAVLVNGCSAPAKKDDANSSGSSSSGNSSGGSSGEDPDSGVEPPVPLGPTEPNCKGLTAKCNNEDCCAVKDVPGGTFNRLNNATYPATISPFKLDVYEVTVGRFRAFANAGFGTKKKPPALNAGQHPKIPGTGWIKEYTDLLTDDKETLVSDSGVRCDTELYKVYDERPGTNDSLPMNCVTWVEAFAFCIWDGGRLPTETEWNFAAAGGSEQREYPWGNVFDATKLTFGCQSGTSTAEPGAPKCTFASYQAAGSHPTGVGRYGHHDMAGSVWERVFDFWEDPLKDKTCIDCVNNTDGGNGTPIRGGSLNWASRFQKTSYHSVEEDQNTQLILSPNEDKGARTNTVGFRCARDK